MPRHVALYCRLSPRPDGSYEGVDLQKGWGGEYAASHWPGVLVVTYPDAGISAANGDHRPEYERLRAAIRAGEVAHLWCVETTRLERREVEWFQLAAELDAAGIAEVHTKRDGIVRVQDEVAGIKAVLAAAEIRRLKARVRDRLNANAAAGIPPRSQPYGFLLVVNNGVKTYDHEPGQAAVVREVAGWVLAGWSLMRIVRELEDRGWVGPRGGKPTTGAIRSMVTTPAVAGLRLHQGRVVGEGNWKPIIDRATWQRVCDKLGEPRTVPGLDGVTRTALPRHRPARRYLLSGYVHCAVCGSRMVGAMKQLSRTGGEKSPYYQCHPKYGGKGCVGIRAEPTEQHVLSTLMDELAKPELLAALAADDHAQRRDQLDGGLAEVDRRRTVLAGMWARNELADDEWNTGRAELAEQEATLRAGLAALPPPPVNIDRAVLADPAVVEMMNLDEQRELLGMVVAKVTIGRATPPFRRFDRSRITVEWRYG